MKRCAPGHIASFRRTPVRWIEGLVFFITVFLFLEPLLAAMRPVADHSQALNPIEGPSSKMSDSNTGNKSFAQTSDGEDGNLIDLVRTLGDAYGNAIKHDTANPDSETTDLLLENASIGLSSRILGAIPPGCAADGPDTNSTTTCDLQDELGLKNLTDMLSYAASQLQRIGRSAGVRNSAETPATARVRSMEHLYRMTFAISKAYFDRSQSHAYLGAAHEQLALARKHIHEEENLCACASEEYGVRLRKLSELDDRLSLMSARGE